MMHRSNLFIKKPTQIIRKFIRNLILGVIAIMISLYIGMLGYHYFEGMLWIDAYASAAMILSGMGPLAPLQTTAGKIFAGSYALFSGLVFILIVGIIFAPLVHMFLHEIHVPDEMKE